VLLGVIGFAAWGWAGWYCGWRGPMGWWAARPGTTASKARTAEGRPPEAVPPGPFFGRTVTLNGKVEQVFAPGEFTLAADHGGQQLLVVVRDAKGPAVKNGEAVRVTGMVETYNAESLHKQTGIDLGQLPPGDFAGRPVVLALSVSPRVNPR
jgi:hypothetical protein